MDEVERDSIGGPRDILTFASAVLTRLGIRHFVTGSMGAMVYGEYRATLDVDIVADMHAGHPAELVMAFPQPRFYLSEDAMRSAIGEFGQFNVIHVPSALKVDFMIPKRTPFNESRFARVRAIAMDPTDPIPVSSAEDVILMKLRSFQEGGSDKHLRDIASMIRISGESFDRAYLDEWAHELGVDHEWTAVRQRVHW